ncbi:hypothetical protein [Priestia megaterium]|uniref:hypothetical protein n=1 Tax=Priestia megaterium TaxID=1404 RepID=UPI001BE62B85|nr:hypothetical protein [Priestia megaterium]MBT2259193.1 hypothetical protein [Priestia megaterium]
MKNKFVFVLLLLIGLTTVFVSSSNAKTLSTFNKQRPYVEIYNEKGKLVQSYTDGEIKGLMKEVADVKHFLDIQRPENGAYMNSYDEDGTGRIIDSSSKEVLDVQKSIMKKAAPHKLQFYQSTTFNDNVWLANQSMFSNPTDLIMYFSQPFDKIIVKLIKDNKVTCIIKVGNLQGVVHVPLTKVYKEAGDYQLQFVNANKYGKEVNLKGGILYHD